MKFLVKHHGVFHGLSSLLKYSLNRGLAVVVILYCHELQIGPGDEPIIVGQVTGNEAIRFVVGYIYVYSSAHVAFVSLFLLFVHNKRKYRSVFSIALESLTHTYIYVNHSSSLD